MKTLSKLVMVLLCLLFLQGTAVAVLGVLDDVPARDLVFPIICAKDDPSGMNTVWYIAETAGGIVGQGLAGLQHVFVRNRDGVIVMDYDSNFSPLDVVDGNCRALINGMSSSMKHQLEVTLDGVVYYAGYITTHEVLNAGDHYVGWIYLIDSSTSGKLDTVAGFKPFQAEGGVDDNNLGEDMGIYPVRAKTVFPRYYILNPDIGSRTWWIVLTAKQPNTPTVTNSLRLDGFFCNEGEMCISNTIPINHRLEFIDVNTFLPPLGTSYPKAGFAKLDVLLTTTTAVGGPIVMTPDYSFFMWSYTRACYLPKSKKCDSPWTAMHPVDRFYQYPQ